MLRQLSEVAYLINTYRNNKDLVQELYINDLRTPLFMLEGLARIYRKIYDKKVFEPFLILIKKLEDALEEYDYWYVLHQQLQPIENIATVKNKVASNIDNAKTTIMQILTEDGWLNEDFIELNLSVLASISWKDETDSRKEFKKVYQKEIDKIKKFINTLQFPLASMEDEVHELRRKIRWLSIYIHASDGPFELVSDKNNLHLNNYNLDPHSLLIQLFLN